MLIITPLIVFIVLALGVFYINASGSKQTVIDSSSKPSPEPEKSEEKVFYPMTSYEQRLTFRKFGQKVTAADKPKCGRAFFGIHNADDLEILPGEENSDVPVFAAVDGKVVYLDNVDGYGGLLVLKGKLNNEDMTFNYGHIKLASAKFSQGSEVKAGDEIAILGKGCSRETDFERKHLHFAIHKGITVDVSGYLQNESELSDWLNPLETLKNNNAFQK